MLTVVFSYIFRCVLRCRPTRSTHAQSDWDLSQSVISCLAPSSGPTPRPRELLHQPGLSRAHHQTGYEPHSAVRESTSMPRPCNGVAPTTTNSVDRRPARATDDRFPTNHTYDSCGIAAAITRQQVEWLNACRAPHRPAASSVPHRNLSQNPTVVWPYGSGL